MVSLGAMLPVVVFLANNLPLILTGSKTLLIIYLSLLINNIKDKE
jgi:hypothetical protein